MQLGIIGLPMVGKTTIFQLLTKTNEKTSNQAKANTAIAKIPDNRIDFLSKLYKPKKTTYAQLEIVDIPGLISGTNKGAAVFLDSVRKADALLQVVRAFDDEDVPAVTDEINPIKDIDSINYELLLADLDLVEKRIERINENKKKNQMQKELSLLEKLKETLSNETPLLSVELDEEEKLIVDNYQFLTTKPMFWCLNIGEDDLLSKDYPYSRDVLEYAKEKGIPIVELSASIEKEIAELDEDEKNSFLEELGIDESGVVKIARGMYERLGLISFFTVGDDEVKAWTVEKGTVAKKAAGKIHSDIERGFIRAEVVEYDDLYEWGSMNALKEKGLFRLEGKEYIVKDGDVIHFRFNV
ncbi:GTP-binding and nucleic acid-binding protein YchF [Candidatus Syntrophocurvum alkaliphilum]|uniref:Ribosome-binding ATPase YchF n=1 Tax=Candidatus Syntrophocurvum alkaliphilum TaxID=2293317 RepID=A0A6I6D8X9_9FIRM|nr:redox-regulated ATPase YchF [Candidatus Syntrophocurvum alkaliphilum]QGT99325.1 GTP-binding and nucleic acid-binding protein YchF [Candidatus Syntrophocurvum alkaliphilum]